MSIMKEEIFATPDLLEKAALTDKEKKWLEEQ